MAQFLPYLINYFPFMLNFFPSISYTFDVSIKANTFILKELNIMRLQLLIGINTTNKH